MCGEPHDGGSIGPLPRDVTDHDAPRSLPVREDVVEIAADLVVRGERQVESGELHAVDVGHRRRQQAPLQGSRHRRSAVVERGALEGRADAVRGELEQLDVVAGEVTRLVRGDVDHAAHLSPVDERHAHQGRHHVGEPVPDHLVRGDVVDHEGRDGARDLPGDASSDRDRRGRPVGLHADGRVLDQLGARAIEQEQRRRIGAEDLPERVQELVREVVEVQLGEGRVGDRLDLLQTPRQVQEPLLRLDPLRDVLEHRDGPGDRVVVAPADGAESTSIITVVPSPRSIDIGSPITTAPVRIDRLIG